MKRSREAEAGRHAPRRNLRRELLDDIDHALERRSAPAGTLRAHVEDATKRGGAAVLRVLRTRPSLGVVVFGGLAIAAADLVGVGELGMGIVIGYAAWQVLRKGEPVGEAIEEAEQLAKV